ncbi:hypothetical protein [Gracilibacillus kekensis]|uniref:Lon proteolytic domain-containing protein n=1 Tax=Gracilibacillus kekensis TaxID=1027249 RepID=A0A1M7LFC5_9BACI|nr:hypothetical protein [Gracilibacillus kekensis]SHM76775.1 hypothetical protein SAMN05216179_1057 [Gracilibacillus kekensis]
MGLVSSISKEAKVSALLLFVPLLITVILLFPKHEEYIATGDIVPVEELGVSGSVYFTYVNLGVTQNIYEKLTIQYSYDEIEFIPLDSYEHENYIYQLEEMEFSKDEVVSNAVHLPIFEQSQNSNELLYNKMSNILENSSSYAGDSFGLMLTIGLYEEMYKKDFSKNGSYIIAGTGTINPDYSIGEVGAIRHKLLTAEQNNVDVFFIPDNKDSYSGQSNFEEALEIVKEEKLSFQVVPVAKLDDAISYLENS